MRFDREGRRIIENLSLAPSTIPTKQKSFENRNVHNKFHRNNQLKKKNERENENNELNVKRIQ